MGCRGAWGGRRPVKRSTSERGETNKGGLLSGGGDLARDPLPSRGGVFGPLLLREEDLLERSSGEGKGKEEKKREKERKKAKTEEEKIEECRQIVLPLVHKSTLLRAGL